MTNDSEQGSSPWIDEIIGSAMWESWRVDLLRATSDLGTGLGVTTWLGITPRPRRWPIPLELGKRRPARHGIPSRVWPSRTAEGSRSGTDSLMDDK